MPHTFQNNCHCGGGCATCGICGKPYSAPVRGVHMICTRCTKALVPSDS